MSTPHNQRFEPKEKDENLPHMEDQFPRDPSKYHYSDHFRNKIRKRNIPIEGAIEAIEAGDLQDSRGGAL